jgi:elongation factor G
MLTLTPSTPADAERLAAALQQLTAVGDQFRVVQGDPRQQVTIACVHERQLEVVVDRLKHEFGVSARLSAPTVFYKETLTAASEGEMKYVRQAAGRGVYAHVKLRVHPANRGEGRSVLDRVAGGAIPAPFVPHAIAGVCQALDHGVLADHPIDDVVVEVYDGSYHDEDSTAAAFEIAGAMALLDAARKGHPVTLEPIMRVDVEIPSRHADQVSKAILARRGRIVSWQELGRFQSIVSRIPLAALFGFEGELYSRTGSATHVAISLADFQVLQPEGDSDRGRDSHVGAPRKPDGPRRLSGIALPEPDDPYSSL